MDESIALFQVTARGGEVARKIKGAFKGVVVFGPRALKGGALKKKAGRAFSRFDALVFISAAGIAVRTIAPFIRDKTADPAVVAVDETGKFVVSLLSGHLGGANRLAREIASVIKGTAVVTTATELHGLPCIEDVARKFSLSIDGKEAIKALNSAILDAEKVLIADANKERREALKRAFGKFSVFVFSKTLSTLASGQRISAAAVITNLERYTVPRALRSKTLVLRPRDVVVGIGCRSGTTEEEISRAVKKVFRKAGLSTLSIRNIATAEIKRGEQGLIRYAGKRGLGIEYFSSKEINRVDPPSGVSLAAVKNAGLVAVAEPAALLSSGAKYLCVRKTKTKKVTVAVAEAPFTS